MKTSPNNPAAAPARLPERASASIGGMRVDAGNYAETTAQILGWAHRAESRYVCVANVHMLMETHDNRGFREIVNAADRVTSDGMPLVWMLRRRGHRTAERVYGPTLMLWLCEAAAAAGVPVALFGGGPSLLEELGAKLLTRFPRLTIAARVAPPFGDFSPEQNADFAQQLRTSGARIVFIGLGCPKQERWMAEMSGKIPAVLVGVGAAFNFHAGKVRQSPAWMQRLGLEWLFRFAMEPRRLWRRYLWHNPRFLWLMAREEWAIRFGKSSPERTFTSR